MEIRHKTRVGHSSELGGIFGANPKLKLSAKRAIRIEIAMINEQETVVVLTNADGIVEEPVKLSIGQAMTVDHVFTLEDQAEVTDEAPFPLIFSFNGTKYKLNRTRQGKLILNK